MVKRNINKKGGVGIMGVAKLALGPELALGMGAASTLFEKAATTIGNVTAHAAKAQEQINDAKGHLDRVLVAAGPPGGGKCRKKNKRTKKTHKRKSRKPRKIKRTNRRKSKKNTKRKSRK